MMLAFSRNRRVEAIKSQKRAIIISLNTHYASEIQWFFYKYALLPRVITHIIYLYKIKQNSGLFLELNNFLYKKTPI